MDPRFEAVKSDPRFAAPPKKKHASEALKDERFKGLLDDPDFNTDAATKRPVDKRGRRVPEAKQHDEKSKSSAPSKRPKQSQVLAEAAAPQPLKGKDGKHKASVKNLDTAAADAKVAAARWARARGLTAVPSSSDGSDSDSEDKEEEEEERPSRSSGSESDASATSAELSEDSADEPLTEDEEINEQDLIDELALVDLDWDVVRAVDILAALNSFKTKNGAVHRVTVYPSDYGLQRMADEAANGPKALAPPPKRKKSHVDGTAEAGGSSDEKEDEDGADGEKVEHDSDSSSDSGDEVDKLRIRLYEQSKLRYYYAVAECDSAATASALYEACDGAELGRGTGGGCKLDLRFVPKETSFDGRQVRDVATGVPFGYAPPVGFSAALQHTKPQLTWDADDAGRKKLLNRKMSETDLKDEDFRAYLASSSGDDEDDEEQATVYGGQGGVQQGEGAGQDSNKKQEKAAAAASLRDRYRALLLGGSSGPKEEEEESEQEEEDSRKGDEGSENKGKGGSNRSRTKAWGAAHDGSVSEGKEGEPQGSRGAAAQTVTARKGGKDKGSQGLEMEVTFVPGLEGLKNKIEEKRKSREAKQAETVWEAYLRRKKEKAKMRKQKSRGGGSSSSSEDDEPVAATNAKGKEGKGQPQAPTEGAAADGEGNQEADPFDDPFFNDDGPAEMVPSGSDEEDLPKSKAAQTKGKKKGREAGGQKEGDKSKGKQKKGPETTDDSREAAELELLLMDDDKLRAGKLRHESKQAEQKGGPEGKGKKAKLAEARALQQQRKAAAAEQAPQHGGAAGAPGDHRGASEAPSSLQGAGEEGSGTGHSNGAGSRSRQQLELKSMVAHLKRKQQKLESGGSAASGSNDKGNKKRGRDEEAGRERAEAVGGARKKAAGGSLFNT
ncbi:hypothetical protein DUNSADRAFT_4049 [Dunaliella salina]|uniref:ESF1 RRM domain-containing protein n=1 Tax=Dunaliella salina TaxID=3046 RepID=A0ABQ7GSU6_DUNSA|nr:hypothetical protein DUNSADRAFT_4049 [Dunaliella salina]|eukprot:KAF5837684.1 hypothetical protein DUNSADRAFT_4049 [Dunaliella salina]